MTMTKQTLAHLALTAAVLVSALTATAAERPNVILMMADDLGYNDLSCYGSEKLRTPQLDKLASEGVRLTSFYAGNAVCTPSRMALLTGAYPKRVGWPGGVLGYKIDWKQGLAPQALTIAEVFKGAGYATGISGKWHLGDGEGMQPMKQGFDSALYIKSSNNQTTKLWRGEELVADPFDNRRLTEQFSAEAIRFIQANRENPFFLYLPFTAPHFPAQAHPDWKGKSANAAYGDVVEELDHRVGEILKTLESEKLDRKTIVVFLSDNGPEKGQRKWASAKPFRGLKWTTLEGGTRVPCIVRWPGVIQAKRESDELTTAIDLLPTLAHACGIDLKRVSKASPKIDGVNVWDTLIGKKGTTHARTNLLYWNGWAKLEAIRDGDWKLFLTKVDGVPGSESAPVLIHLKEDPTEQTDLAAKHPDRVKAMQTLAKQIAADIDANSLPLGGE
ncbi:MAG: arylsulfatase A [Verrucomicrobiales bacterium]|jgi:arylsulfatase A